MSGTAQPAPKAYSIGDLARATDTRVNTIRFYEQRGLLPEPPRSDGGQRRYDRAHLDRLAFIRHGRALGFSLDAIAELLALSDDPDAPCAQADQIARGHLAAVEKRISQLQALHSELTRITRACQGGSIGDCRIIEALSD
ncbi:helix-turn-helix domain-containing protein [Breoghania sp. L-A4]|uniref:MerR family transcriptional regulator n=1 Tax=Breoghania sp. L-A4 TaxID=2304600 RepID=UPI000E35C585|nr:helix-turn-helix domain-containing protein [Breoghania sp. L-A4]AXS39477.1 MerR family transcriptional regulator [Breoghania sp. L-A4]